MTLSDYEILHIQLKKERIGNTTHYFKYVNSKRTYSGVTFGYWRPVTRTEYNDLKAKQALIAAAQEEIKRKRREEEYDNSWGED